MLLGCVLSPCALSEALEFHGVLIYLREVIGDYFGDRSIEYTGRSGARMRREILRGVPQGLVLGPLLWNVAYDWVLRGALRTGLSVLVSATPTTRWWPVGTTGKRRTAWLD